MASTLITKPFKRVCLNEGGHPGWRTALMPRRRAESFAACVGSRESVKRAEAVFQPAANPPDNWYVFVIPTDPRQAEVREWLQAQREDRAEAEGHLYQFFDDWRLQGGAVYCVSASGNVYEVSEDRCTCPDFGARCRKVQMLCKHILTLRRRGRCVVVKQGADR